MLHRFSTAATLVLAFSAQGQVYKTPDPKDVSPTPFIQPQAPRRSDHRNAFVVVNLVSSRASDKPLLVDPLLKDAWGLAIRPPGKGGHWWSANTVTGTTTTYIGDAPGVPFGQDDLKVVPIPVGKLHEKNETTSQPTGMVYSAWNKGEFRFEGKNAKGEAFTDYARFVFVTLDGTVSAWANDMVSCVNLVDRGAEGAMYTGVTMTEKADGGEPAVLLRL